MWLFPSFDAPWGATVENYILAAAEASSQSPISFFRGMVEKYPDSSLPWFCLAVALGTCGKEEPPSDAPDEFTATLAKAAEMGSPYLIVRDGKLIMRSLSAHIED